MRLRLGADYGSDESLSEPKGKEAVSETLGSVESLLHGKVDPRVFNPMLLAIRHSEPLLYRAILSYPLVAGGDLKQEAEKAGKDKDKKKRKRKEKERKDKVVPPLVPDFTGKSLSLSLTAQEFA